MNRAIGMNGKDFDGRSVMVMKSESRSKRNDGDRSSGRERHDRNDSEDRHNHHGSSYDDRSRDRSRERDDYRSNRSYDDSNKIIVLRSNSFVYWQIELSWDAKKEDLEDLFSQYGRVEHCAIITDRETGRSRGRGIVKFATAEAMEAAVSGMDGQEFMGRKIGVRKFESRR